MTDINGTVVGIQGREVDDTAPSDGYALIWDEGDTKWKPKPNGLNRQYFTSSGTWTCPEGITSILIIACGGGSGGSAGFAGTFDYVNDYGPVGINAIQVISTLIVIPGTVYTIIIGAGGIGGTGSHIITPYPPSSNTIVVERSEPTAGGSTSFSQDETVLFSVRGATLFEIPTNVFINTYNDGYQGLPALAYIEGNGGLGGLAGPQGNGGNGGDGAVSLSGGPAVASNGFNAGDNTGAGGGCGGNCGFDDFPCDCTAGNGGNGGSGYMYIIY